MRILALDTSTLVQSVAICTCNGPAVERTYRVERGHTGSLLLSIDSVLKEAGLTPFDLDLVAVGIGPGSFTGLRIGMAAVKALCLATSCPAVPVSSLAAMAFRAAGLGSDRWIVTATDARKQQVYAAVWRIGRSAIPEAQIEPFACTPQELERTLAEVDGPMVGLGNGFDLIGLVPGQTGRFQQLEILTDEYWWPRASSLAELGQRLYLEKGPVEPSRLEPEYIRPSDAELNWSRRRTEQRVP